MDPQFTSIIVESGGRSINGYVVLFGDLQGTGLLSNPHTAEGRPPKYPLKLIFQVTTWALGLDLGKPWLSSFVVSNWSNKLGDLGLNGVRCGLTMIMKQIQVNSMNGGKYQPATCEASYLWLSEIAGAMGISVMRLHTDTLTPTSPY